MYNASALTKMEIGLNRTIALANCTLTALNFTTAVLHHIKRINLLYINILNTSYIVYG